MQAKICAEHVQAALPEPHACTAEVAWSRDKTVPVKQRPVQMMGAQNVQGWAQILASAALGAPVNAAPSPAHDTEAEV